MKKERKYEWKGAIKAVLVIAVLCAGIGFAMAKWDDTKSTGDTLTAAEWNAMVADQKNRTSAGAYTYLVGVNTADDDVPGDTGYWVRNMSAKVVFTEDNPNHAENAIQYAFNALTDGGKLVFGEGTFYFSNKVTTSSNNLTIAGTGRGTILQLVNGANCEFFHINNNGITVQDIVFDGNVENQTDGYAAINVTAGVKNLVVKDCHFQNMWRAGIKGEGTSDEPIVGIRVHDCTGKHFRDTASHQGGLVWLNYAKDVQLTNLFCEDFGESDAKIEGVKVTRSKDIQISELMANDVTAHIVFVGYGSENIEISDIFVYNEVKGGLEPVCIEWAGDGTHTGTPRNKNVAISNVIYITKAGVNNGVFVWTADNVTVENCIVEVLNQPISSLFNFRYLKNAHITNCVAVGLMGGDRYHFFVSDSESVSLTNCISTDVPEWNWTTLPRAGLVIYGDCKDISVSHCTFKNLPTRGIFIQVQPKQRITIQGCKFIDMGMASQGLSYAIHTTADQVSGLDILGNIFAVENSTIMHGIYIDNGNDDIVIKGNVFRGTPFSYKVVVLSGVTGCVVKNNEGYVTENKGTATITNGSSSVVVNHGLAKAPEHGVRLTGTHSEVANCWVTNVTDTQFTINAPSAVTADRYVFWKAEV